MKRFTYLGSFSKLWDVNRYTDEIIYNTDAVRRELEEIHNGGPAGR